MEITPNDTAPRESVGITSNDTAPDVRMALKRTFDVLLSAAILVVTLPLIAVVAAAILLESGGPVLYRAERVGRHGRAFWMLKFRKMHAHANGPKLTTQADARFTRVGAVLAGTKLDELPQLLNVLRGEMSLIGPRPEDPAFVAQRRDDYDVILRVRPGITGLAQLAFAEESRILSPEDPVTHYLEAIFPQKCRLDRLYVAAASLRTDIRILFWTLIAILFRRRVAVDRATGRMTFRRRRARPDAPARREEDVDRERAWHCAA